MTTFAFLFGLLALPPAVVTSLLAVPLYYFANMTAFWILSVITFLLCVIINIIILEEHSVLRSVKFDPLDIDEWKKQKYEKSFDKLTK